MSSRGSVKRLDSLRVTSNDFNPNVDNVSYGSSVPEPAIWLLLVGGLSVVTAVRRRRTS